ncbi:desmoglein-4-like [Spea bombifrons]|uniref:desmoglein-4-like n=1 Tax=Spea bombifrons TaxID=233779 RepID=UPI00234A2C6A|nr:desmoglein-4-like [Spea bombifrons]
MDWLLCAKFGAFFVLMVALQCSCEWHIKVNHGKDENGKIMWEPLQLKRQKREWIIPPVNIREEEDNRYRNPIAKVHSDAAIKTNIRYTVSGPGVDMYPFGVFLINPRTGDLNVTGVTVDREQISIFFLVVRAISNNGADLEKPLELRVRVLDINDNPPIFMQSVFVGSIAERSRANTLVMVMNATDADEQGTINSQIAYKIISQSPAEPPMFIMNKVTGQVFTMTNFLDREQQSSYSIMVGGSDLNGGAGGLSGQCGGNIQILDVNDNFPTLEFDSYSVQIIENMVGLTNLRIRAFDLDEMYTDNWIAEFNIVSGNEGGWFVMETDTQTNEGILRVVKALDYEAMQSLNLGFVVTNRAAFHTSVISEFQAKVTSISIQVQNEREGPSFVPSTQYVQIPSGLSGEALYAYILATMRASDVDTGGPATNIRYVMGLDVENWLIIDSITGEIRIVREMTRESSNVVNGTYTAEILAINDDVPARTATATIVLNVPATNNNCPVITNEVRQVCVDNMRVAVQAFDNDSAPYGAPFTFTITNNPDQMAWSTQRIDDTSVALVGSPGTVPRNVTLQISVRDNGNLSCPAPWPVRLQICECTTGGVCDATKMASKSVSLGPAAIGLLILGFLVLLLALLLLPFCLCGSAAKSAFVPVADGYDGACRPWETEGAKPEDVDMTSMLINSGAPGYSDLYTTNNMIGVGTGAAIAAGAGAAVAGGIAGASGVRESSVYGERTIMGEGTGLGNMLETAGRSGESNIDGSLGVALPSHYKEGGTLNMAYIENYFAEKADAYANEDESRPANDCLLIYDNEGIGSPAGSIGCCSFIADDLEEDYLDTLGPKFKTLAEICVGKEIDPVLSGEEPRVSANVPLVETDTTVRYTDTSNLIAYGGPPVPVVNSSYVAESSYTSSSLQPARPIPDNLIPGNVVVTETYTTSGTSMNPATHQPNIVVTERVVGPASGVQGGFPEIPDGSNVIVTERVMRPVSGVHDILDFPDLSDSSNVVLRERVIGPSNSRLSNSFNIPEFGDGQNVVVTERLIQPASSARGGSFGFPHDVSAGQNVIVTEKTVRSGTGMTNQLLSTEPLLTQSIGSTSPSLTRSKVTKYSKVQYTKQ